MQLIEKYMAVWNETDDQARAKLIADVFTAEATYTDPLVAVTGRDQIDGMVAVVRGQFPELGFQLAGPVDAHHDVARFIWHLGSPGEEPIAIGSDVAMITDGRIAHVVGFLDKIPS